MLECLGERSRFRIARALVRGERCVSEVAVEVALSQSCTTRHLQRLARCGLVRSRRCGRQVLYRLWSERRAVRELMSWLGSHGIAPGPHGAALHQEPAPTGYAAGTGGIPDRRRNGAPRRPGRPSRSPDVGTAERPRGQIHSPGPGMARASDPRDEPAAPGTAADPATDMHIHASDEASDDAPVSRRTGDLEDFLL